MDIESAALQRTSTQSPDVQGEPKRLEQLREENKSLKEELHRLRNSRPQPPREASLDVCRGLATAIMIIDKYTAKLVPVMNYAPWDGINVADFGPPMFLFLAGVSTALAHASTPNNKITATANSLRRSVWLFGLGILLEGGFFHDSLHFGIDLGEFRVFGTLQRLAVAYFGTSLCEIWATRSGHWALTALIPATSAALLYGLHVPDWSFPLGTSNISNNPCTGIPVDDSTSTTLSMGRVSCGVRGFYNTEPACNAAAHIDRLVLGVRHLNPVAGYKHLPMCGGKTYQGIIPDWCYAPFESEGILTTVSATATSLIGLHFGHVLVEKKQHLARLWSWTLPSASLIVVGMALHNVGLLFNRQLWSFSYLCFTAGTAGTVWSSVYFLVEANGWRGGLSPLLKVVGRHSLLLFGLLQCDVMRTGVQGFYHRCPQNNILSYLRDHRITHRILELLQRQFCH